MGSSNYPKPELVDLNGVYPINRLQALDVKSATTRQRTDELIALAKRGLPQMHRHGAFAHTVRATYSSNGPGVRREGDSLRYTSNVALGLGYVDEDIQRQVLGGSTAADLALVAAARAEVSIDMGAVALAAWTLAEVAGRYAAPLFQRLSTMLSSEAPVETVTCSWTLIAALAARQLADTGELATQAANRLMEEQGASGLFPHMLPASANGRLRAHVGCFADQVYSIQGLSRLHALRNDRAALAAADACAAAICAVQGPEGQWWWHYDIRDGSVVEGYPVYSVHQHAMGPMALLDLREAGGTDHLEAVIKGLQWLDRHPEVTSPLVSEQESVIWRKAGRREPRKAVRMIAAVTTALKPGLHLPGLDTIFPPNQVDRECRPYELGWLLYAWLCGGAVDRMRR
ncbi:hypothetical protein [Aminobacter sp. AP02]|uniref:hypothetical protein n=1 Tax=Aminobacter sp. AP02 TaxID=2135737 RepID=UPI000D6DBACC|nr:hypothetical protein [Aminobacter sp. AP02]PWK76870.1 hypothetical protein C8K44_101196 [Aminobacter sp. AP02]